MPLSGIKIAVGQPGEYVSATSGLLLITSAGLAWLQEVTSVYAVLVLQDYHLGSTNWYDIGTVNLLAAISGPDGFYAGGTKLNSDAIYWALTLFYSYRTYGDGPLLDNAKDAWDIVYTNAFITPGDAANGSGAGRNVSFLPPENCVGGAGLSFLSMASVTEWAYRNIFRRCIQCQHGISSNCMTPFNVCPGSKHSK